MLLANNFKPMARLGDSIRELGVYAAIALIVPGGSLIAVCVWAFRHRKRSRREADRRADAGGKASTALFTRAGDNMRRRLAVRPVVDQCRRAGIRFRLSSQIAAPHAQDRLARKGRKRPPAAVVIAMAIAEEADAALSG